MESSPLRPASSDNPGGDKVGQSYWDRMWEKSALPPALDPFRHGLKNYPVRKFHEFFRKTFHGFVTKGKKLIEIGCAQSVFLPYFAQYFEFEVAGLDRSEIGCDKARKILERGHVAGEIYSADFFSPPTHLIKKFDVLVSFGVVEHCENSSESLRAMAGLLKSGGMMITTVPHLRGLPGALQRRLDREIYDIHIPFDTQGLAAVHAQAGLRVAACDYLMPINLEVLNVDSWPRGIPYWLVIRTLGVISRMVWLVDGFAPILKPNRRTSPYIGCVSWKT
jgi:SAM-dependent methyltransferase